MQHKPHANSLYFSLDVCILSDNYLGRGLNWFMNYVGFFFYSASIDNESCKDLPSAHVSISLAA